MMLEKMLAELRRPEGPKAEHHNYKNRTTYMYRIRDPCNSLFMVNMTSGMDHERMRPTMTTTTSNNMSVIKLANTKSCSLVFQLISLILDIHIV